MHASVAMVGGWAAVRHRQLPRKENSYHEKNEPVEPDLGNGYLRLDELQLQKGKKKRIRSRRVKSTYLLDEDEPKHQPKEGTCPYQPRWGY